jgi:hypothetical protein
MRPAGKQSRDLAQLLAKDVLGRYQIDRNRSGSGRGHSPSFDQRRRPGMLRTAMAIAFFCPTSTAAYLCASDRSPIGTNGSGRRDNRLIAVHPSHL